MKQFAVFIYFLAGAAAVDAQTPSPTPPEIREEVTVTANRIETRISDTPASVDVVSKAEIGSTAAPTIDEVLRQTVGFSIFRRTSSRAANPTTQGVSLRGVGSSGASRTIVLFDGVPLNDPFGGWIQWNRVVPIGVASVEVQRGGASSLYGNAGLSGAINVKPRIARPRYEFSADIFGGSQQTLSGSTFAGFNASGWTADITAGAFHTSGYKPLDAAVRGPVDDLAGVSSSSFSIKVARSLGNNGAIFLRPTYFSERRTNGTVLQTNQTHIRQLAAGGDHIIDTGRDMRLVWRAYGGTQTYDQVFTAVKAARTVETITRLQRVPAQMVGGMGQISLVLGGHVLLAGADFKNVRGATDEVAYVAGNPTTLVDSGGRENTIGVFVQDFMRLGDQVVVAASLRYDRWRNFGALTAARPIGSEQTTASGLPDRIESTISPQLSALYHVSDNFSFFASASRSFRAPTLNELYRGFRVGNVQTLANENLAAERAVNAEAGARFSRGRSSLRGNVFWTNIDGPVSNVTLSVTPNLITRQRQNAGRTRSRGVEIEGEFRLWRLDVTAGYLLADSTVRSFPANPVLEGLRVPQVARHQFTLQTRLTALKWTLAMQARASSSQFDDDLNQFRLEPYGQVDVYGARRLSENLQIYGAIENIFNSRYSTGRTPLRTVNSPFSVRFGLRWK